MSCFIFLKKIIFSHCPTGGDSWCRYDADIANNTSTYKAGRGIPIDIVYKIRPIYKGLSQNSKLEKCLYGNTQNANENFKGTILEGIQKNFAISQI